MALLGLLFGISTAAHFTDKKNLLEQTDKEPEETPDRFLEEATRELERELGDMDAEAFDREIRESLPEDIGVISEVIEKAPDDINTGVGVFTYRPEDTDTYHQWEVRFDDSPIVVLGRNSHGFVTDRHEANLSELPEPIRREIKDLRRKGPEREKTPTIKEVPSPTDKDPLYNVWTQDPEPR